MIEIGAMYMGGDGITVKEFAVAAEAAGFDSVWTGDHLAHYVDGIASLGIVAGCTERVTIGTNVLVAPFRPAAVVAKALLTTAQSARRRVVMGVGPGGDVPIELAMAGADSATRGRYTDEALDVIAGLWSGRPFSYAGRWNRFDEVVMEPVAGPRPDVWIGGRSPAALRRAVRRGHGYNPYLVSPEQVAERYAALQDGRRRGGCRRRRGIVRLRRDDVLRARRRRRGRLPAGLRAGRLPRRVRAALPALVPARRRR